MVGQPGWLPLHRDLRGLLFLSVLLLSVNFAAPSVVSVISGGEGTTTATTKKALMVVLGLLSFPFD